MRKGKLSRKALIKHIRSTMPEGLTELEILAYIEKAIADNVVFDEGYLWSDNETKKKIYKLSKQEALQRKDTVKRKMICINMAELYAYIAGEFGIEVELQRIARDEESFKIENEIGGTEVLEKISEEKLEHVCPIANLKDGRRIVIDIQNDLELLQTRSRPLDFGKGDGCSQVPKPIDILSEEEVESVFRKIYELQEGETRIGEKYQLLIY